MHDPFDDHHPLAALHVAHHAEVQVAQAAVWEGEQVAGVRVGVEVSVVEHLPQRALHEGVDEAVRAEALLDELVVVDEPHAVHPLHREHAVGREGRVHARHEHVREVRVQLREPLRVGGLGLVVDLPVNELAEIVDD